jgi:hypothetical protein
LSAGETSSLSGSTAGTPHILTVTFAGNSQYSGSSLSTTIKVFSATS